MSFSRLVFYFLVLFSIPILGSVVRSAVRGKLRDAFMMLRVYLVVVAVYATVLLATTLSIPIQLLTVGEPQFSGDWSIAVRGIRRFPHDQDENYEVDFQLSNRGTKPIHGQSRLIVYLLTEDGTRFNPNPVSDPSTPPFDALVNPGKSITTTRIFVMPTNLNRIELVIARQGFRLDWFVIGRTPFDGRTVVKLQ